MEIKKILHYVVLGGLFVIPFIPLYVASSMFFPFIAGKNFAFRIIVEIIFFAWLILALRDRNYLPRRSWILIAGGAIVLILALADMFGPAPYKSFWSNYERMEGLVTFLHLLAYLVVAGVMFRSARVAYAFWNTVLGVSVIEALYGLLQLSGKITINQGGARLDGTFGNAAYMAVYMLVNIFIAGFLFARTKESWKRWVYAGVIVLETFILYHTATRGTMLGLLGGAFVTTLLIAIFGKENKRLRLYAASLLAGVVLLVGGFILVRNTEFIQSSPVLVRFASISFTEQTTISRFLVWRSALHGFTDRPLLGWGQENFNYVFNKYYDPAMYNQEPWFDRTHNVFLDWLIQGGLLGLIAYLFLNVSIVVYVWRKGSRFSLTEKTILSGLLAGYFVHNFFVFDNLGSYILFFALAAFVHADRVYDKNEPMSNERSFLRPETINFGIVPLVLIVFVGVLYFANVKPIRANQTLIVALQNQSANPKASLEAFKKTFSYQSFGNMETRERLLDSAQIMLSQNIDQTVTAELVTLAKDQMDEQLKSTPTDARHQLFIGSFLDRVGRFDEAMIHLNAALAASPQKQAILFERGSSYLSQNKLEEALKDFKTAYELDKTNTEAEIIYSIGALYAKQNDLANELLNALTPKVINFDERILNTFVQLKMYDRVLAIWDSRLVADPNNPQSMLSRAAALVQLGRRSEAIAQIEQIKKIRPELSKEADYYIDQIRSGKEM